MRLRRKFVGLALPLAAGLASIGTASASPAAASVAESVWTTLPPTPPLPTPASQGFARTDGAEIWYGIYGHDSRRPPVILLHGGFGNSAYFAKLIPALVKAGYRVIAMDTRGHGRSRALVQTYSYSALAKDVVQAMDRLHIARADVVGWSDGGCIGLKMAVEYPDRLSRLFSFGANADLSGNKVGAAEAPNFARYLDRAKAEYRSISPTPADLDIFEAALWKMWNVGPEITKDQLAHITTPVTVADGQFDETIEPDHNVYVYRTIPNATLVVLPKTSHFAMLQNPAEFNDAVLDFLRWR